MSKSGQCTSIINLTYKDGAEGSPSNPAKYNDQDYARLKEKCRLGGRLFIDSTFPPENQSLGDLPSLDSWEEAQVQWLRPKVKLINIAVCRLLFFPSYLLSHTVCLSFFYIDIKYVKLVIMPLLFKELLQAQGKNEEPVFCTNGATRFDIAQGSLGERHFCKLLRDKRNKHGAKKVI